MWKPRVCAKVWRSYGDTIREAGIKAIPLFSFSVPSLRAVGGPFRAPGDYEAYVVRGRYAWRASRAFELELRPPRYTLWHLTLASSMQSLTCTHLAPRACIAPQLGHGLLPRALRAYPARRAAGRAGVRRQGLPLSTRRVVGAAAVSRCGCGDEQASLLFPPDDNVKLAT